MTSRTLLLTRPAPNAQAFAAMLNADARARVRVVISPVLEIVATGSIPSIARNHAVIFTSANGVLHAPAGEGRKAFCVGAGTVDQARVRGWDAHQAGETAQELITSLTAHPPDRPLMHLGGVHTRGDIAQILTARGIETVHHALYDQTRVPLTDEAITALKGPCIVPVFSPRSAEQLRDQAAGLLGHAHLLALSDSVAAPFVGETRANLTVLPAPRMIYMCKEVEKLCLAIRLP